MKMIKNSLIFFVLLFSFSSFAQENDFQLWNSVSVKKKINKKHSLDLKYGLRFRENGSIVAKNFVDVRTRYKLHKKWSVALGYRNINEWSKYSQLDKKNRFYFDSYSSKKIKRYYFDLRSRVVFQGKISYNEIIRQRIRLSYNLRKTKLEPSLSVESFSSFDNFIDKLRYSLLLSYPINKKTDFNLGYKIQQELNVVDPVTLFIFEIKLIYKI
mgnify:FL=1